MDLLNDSLMLSRLQFAVTAMFHILWPLLTVGLSIFLVAVEVMWLKTADKDYLIHAQFWAKLLLLNIGIGVVSGIPLEFEFGTNWAAFSRITGEFFGNILGYEGATALMLEAGFLGVMMLGWNKVTPGMHLFATSMVAFGSSLSAFWIMIANGWMQAPSGGHIEAGRYVMDSYAKAILNCGRDFSLVSAAHRPYRTISQVLRHGFGGVVTDCANADFKWGPWRLAVV